MLEPEYLAAVEIDEPEVDPIRDEFEVASEIDLEDLLPYDKWWKEYAANACCPSPQAAAARLCGCRGSGAIPSGISRLLTRDDQAEYFFDDGSF